MENKSSVLATASQAICDDEGFRANSYLDTEGVDTIGIGFAKKDLTPEEKQILGDEPVSKQSCLVVLGMKLSSEYDNLNQKIDFFTSLTFNRQIALLDLAYQIGLHGLLGYKHMLADLRAGNIQQAGVDEMDSLEARETPRRAKHIFTLLTGG